MKIERLRMRGFLRFRGTVDLDLASVPAGLVAIVGVNGAGKTTVLEGLVAGIYREFMSRGGLQAYALGSDSFIEQTIAMGDARYALRVTVNGTTRKTTGALLSRLTDVADRVDLNDGLTTTYDTAVDQVFPRRDVLLASAFACQSKAGSFINLERKDRKVLFSQLLGIDRYQAMSDTAGKAAGIVLQARERLDQRRDLLAGMASDAVLASIDNEGLRQEEIVVVETAERRALEEEIAAHENDLASRTSSEAAAAAARQKHTIANLHHQTCLDRKRTAEQDRARVDTTLAETLDRLTTAGNREHASLTKDRQAAVDREAIQVRTATQQRDTSLRDIETRRAGNQKIMSEADTIRAAVTRVKAIDVDLVALRIEHAADAADERLARRDRDEAAQAMRGTERELEALHRARADAELLKTVPCGGKGEFAACAFLSKAAAALLKLDRIDQVTRSLDENKTLVASLDATIAGLVAKADARTKALGALDTERSALGAWAKYEAPLAGAVEKLQALDEAAALAEATYHQAVATAGRELAEREDEIAQRLAELARGTERAVQLAQETAAEGARHADAALVDAELKLAPARDALAAAVLAMTEASELDTLTARTRRELAAAREARDRSVGAQARAEAALSELAKRRQDLQVQRAEWRELEARVATLETEALEWQSLARFLGRDGLITLEIDGAGPTVSGLCNDLLAVCFGPRFTLELATQQAKADGKGTKEDFSIRVLDNERGGEARDIADLSGGEQVIVAEALANAISIYCNSRSPVPIRTCWRDETTGALDPVNTERYMAMLRRVQALGGFHHVFFISQNPDAYNTADAQIQCADGTATIAYPPYAGFVDTDQLAHQVEAASMLDA